MHVINFLLAIFLPYISLFSKLAPPETIPVYFFSDEAAFLAGEFGAVIFYWAGFLRNFVARGTITERQYFLWGGAALAFMCVSKIIFTLPYTWITSIIAFGLGVLSISAGQTVNRKSVIFLVIISVLILLFTSFILIGMGWFGFTPNSYYDYKEFIKIYLKYLWEKAN